MKIGMKMTLFKNSNYFAYDIHKKHHISFISKHIKSSNLSKLSLIYRDKVLSKKFIPGDKNTAKGYNTIRPFTEINIIVLLFNSALPQVSDGLIFGLL